MHTCMSLTCEREIAMSKIVQATNSLVHLLSSCYRQLVPLRKTQGMKADNINNSHFKYGSIWSFDRLGGQIYFRDLLRIIANILLHSTKQIRWWQNVSIVYQTKEVRFLHRKQKCETRISVGGKLKPTPFPPCLHWLWRRPYQRWLYITVL